MFKPSEVTPLVGAMLYDAFASKLPKGVMGLVQGTGEQGAAMVAGDVDAIGFTGSTVTGRLIQKIAPVYKPTN